MATYKDKDGKGWYVSKRYVDWKGQQQRLFKRGFVTKKEAQDYERSFLIKKRNDISMSFNEFIDIYYEDIKDRIKLNTFLTKQEIIEHLIRPYFKDMKVDEIDTTTILKWQNELLKRKTYKGTRLKGETLRTIHAQLSAILNHAVKYYGLQRNVAKVVGCIKTDDVKEQKIWTYEEYKEFLDVISDKTFSYIAFEILFWCGIRVGELLALTPSDIDFENKTLRVNKSLQRIKGQNVITTPKTKHSNRIIDIPEFLCDELKNYLENLYHINDDELLVPISKNYLHHEMRRGCKKLNKDPIRIHDFRHSHVTLLMENGYSATDVGNRVGHEAERITYLYAHAYKQRGKQMADTLNNIEGGIKNERKKSGQER